jgi:hypothetical protein
MDEVYVQGFVDKCAAAGVDPEALVKQSGPYGQLIGAGLKGIGKGVKTFGKALWGGQARQLAKAQRAGAESLKGNEKNLAELLRRAKSYKVKENLLRQWKANPEGIALNKLRANNLRAIAGESEKGIAASKLKLDDIAKQLGKARAGTNLARGAVAAPLLGAAITEQPPAQLG